MNSRNIPVFRTVFFLDLVVWVATVFVGQSLGVGFDPIFYNPIIILFAAILSMFLGAYVPFFVLYKLVFEAVLKRGKIGPVALWAALILPLGLVTVTVNVASYGEAFRLSDLVLPVGLMIVNLLVFYFWRARRLSLIEADEHHDT